MTEASSISPSKDSLISNPVEEKEALSESMMMSSSSVVTDSKKDDDKIVIVFKATGNAPILKKSKFKISRSNSFKDVIQFLRLKVLKLKPSDTLV